jgi:hypothetical protein
MGNSKHRKDHKKKLAQRKTKMAQDKARYEKAKREFIMDLIKKEQERGMFENNPTINPVGPIVDGSQGGPVIEGPSI